MSKVVEMLKEKGIAERIQRNVDRSVALFGKDVPQEEIDKSVRIILDFELHRNPELSDAFAEYALDLLEVDRLGLDKGDRAILETIADKFGGGPVGLDTIAAALGEDSGTIEDVYEPYLIQNGLIERTPRGRAITRLAYEHLHRPVPKV